MFPPDQVYCVLDYETRSEANLKDVGAYEYAAHPSTRIMCVSWAIGTRETLRKAPLKVWTPFLPNEFNSPHELIAAMGNPRIIMVAQNALFEQVITKLVLPRHLPQAKKLDLPPEHWVCTASLAATCALPRNLEGACNVLELPIRKDMEGKKLMLKMTKPRKITKNNSSKWHAKRSDIIRLLDYCKIDVEGAIELLLTLPPLNATERKVWILDQRANLKGILIDRGLVSTILKLVARETRFLNGCAYELTKGEIATTNKRAKVLEWVKARGAPITNLQKKTVEDAIAEGIVEGEAKELLELRLLTSKTSTAKYIAFELRSRFDSFLRDNSLYHGASTGRTTGQGAQIHNLPKPPPGWLSREEIVEAVDVVKDGDLDFIRMLYGKPMELFSALVRSVIIAPKGSKIFSGDYSSIEVRVLFWLADHYAGLRAYERKEDLYIDQAKDIYGRRDILAVTKDERELGKRIILGGGYGMGWKTFFDTCKKYGQIVSEALAKKAVDAYRKKHHHVPRLWRNYEAAAIAAVRNPGKVFAINHVRWFMKGNFLWAELPSGRRLAYHKPTVRMIKKWGRMMPQLYHYGVHPKTKQWCLQPTWGGTLVENVTQAVARDIMVEAALRLDAAGYAYIFNVYDELVTYATEGGKHSLEEFTKLMTMRPEWGKDIPIAVDAWMGDRYRK